MYGFKHFDVWPVAYLEICKEGARGGTFQVYIFKSVQNLAHFFSH